VKVVRVASALGLLGLAACGSMPSEPEPDAGLTSDAGRADAGLSRTDAGADAGTRDAGTIDAGVRDAGPNHPPVVNPDILINRTTVFAGQLAELALGVTDEDGDRLSFTWSGPGTFFENGNPSAQRWFSDERATPGRVTLTVSVTDGRSPAVQRQVSLDVTVPRFSDVFSTVLAVPVLQGGQCVGCHGSMGDFQIAGTRAGGWSQLVNAPHHRGAACVTAGVPSMVVPSDPARSLLYRKMTSTQPSACGDGMPAMSMVVPASPLQHIVTVGSWIRAGALND